jgi:hypothetical protein
LVFHAGNGAVSALIGWNLFGYIDDSGIPLNEPLPVIAAGLAGGLAYWAIAGFSAGFWKPVFRRPARAAVVPPHWRVLAYATALAFGAAVGILRNACHLVSVFGPD